MASEYLISPARLDDLPLLAGIERAAAVLLEGRAPASVLEETTSLSVLQSACAEGRLLIARADGIPVGFAHIEVREPSVAHLEEIDVHPDYGRRGLGTRLVNEVCVWAARRGLSAITLTTFREPPWNMPFYARLGFKEVSTPELSAALLAIIEDEKRRGLDVNRRVAMRRWSMVAN